VSDATVGTVVVPLDGGPVAERALEVAHVLAPAFGASIELVAATDHLTLEEQGVRSGRVYFDAVQASTDGVEIVTVLEPGDAAAVILGRVRGRPNALICMTTRGHTGIGALLLGSVAERVIDGATGPILLIGPHCEPSTIQAPRTDRDPPDGTDAAANGHLIFTYDGSDVSESALPLAVEWARRLDLDLRVVMVLHRDNTFLGDHDSTAARKRARAMIDRLRSDGVPARLELVNGIEPARAISHFASALPAALVVTASHGSGGATRTALGRVATRLAHHCPCPVLVRRVGEPDSVSPTAGGS